ncbi:MAG: hypothetical protein G01um101430_558 [Parcubacteria group bacterium Gr01-1014_30]|nr:MAG: hypothetical protein G01um101430_558 [Parcubacteria group bacterium Gr01-1014_30]
MEKYWESTTEKTTIPTGRSLSDYEKALDFKRDELAGKKVLDLGSGENENLSRELADQNTNVVSLNPEYYKAKMGQKVTRLPDWQRKSVAGEAEALPFKDKTFDRIFGLYSVSRFSEPSYLEWAEEKQDMHQKLRQEDKQQVLNWLSEIARVLKVGGEARLYPFKAESEEEFLRKYKAFFEAAASFGLRVEHKKFDDEEDGGYFEKYLVVLTKASLTD